MGLFAWVRRQVSFYAEPGASDREAIAPPRFEGRIIARNPVVWAPPIILGPATPDEIEEIRREWEDTNRGPVR